MGLSVKDDQIKCELYSGPIANWAHDFLRTPKDFPNKVDIKYLNNQRSAACFFLKWFLQDMQMPYQNMLRKMHYIAACGPDGGNYYKIPNSRGEFILPRKESTDSLIVYETNCPNWVRETHPGEMRCDLEKRSVQHPTQDRLRLTKHDINLWMRASLTNTESCGTPEQTFAKFAGRRFPKNIFIRFKKCKVSLPVKQTSTRCFKRFAPMGVDRDNLLQSCANLLQECKILYLSQRIPELIYNLLCYYHAAINLMPFANINNSIFMAQINSILRLSRISHIPHANLDCFALITSYTLFVKIAKAKNPSLSLYYF